MASVPRLSLEGDGSRCRSVCSARGAAALLLALFASPARGHLGVVEGDAFTELFFNGVFMRPDESALVLPMNNERRVDTVSSQAWMVAIGNDIREGDVFGMAVITNRPEIVNITNALGNLDQYLGLGGVAAAFEDGTLTNSQWRCVPRWEVRRWNHQNAWYLQDYDDSAWPFAVEQTPACCPWRDTRSDWGRLNAPFIGPAIRSGNNSGPREFMCRYKVPVNSSRIMDGSGVLGNDTAAPRLTVSAFEVGSSLVQVTFNVSGRARVHCGIVDARFVLRTPSPLELQAWGTSIVVDASEAVWQDVTSPASVSRSYTTTALDWVQVSTAANCRAACDGNSACSAITYYDVGADIATGTNCKLMTGISDADLDTVPSDTARFAHMRNVAMPVETNLAVPGLLLPGTVYRAYCAAFDVDTGAHTSWQGVEATRITARTSGCLDCGGGSSAPAVTIMGGYASQTSITAVVLLSAPGRVFCAAAPSQSNATGRLLTIDEIKAAGFSNIVAVSGTSAPVTVSGLANTTLHEVSCVAEGDGGSDSEIENVDANRRWWYTEIGEIPIVSMRLMRQSTDPGIVTIEMRGRLDKMGYLWCMLEESQRMINFGVPRNGMIQQRGNRQRVETLDQDAAGMFPGLDAASSYEIYCTAREDDFSEEMDASNAFDRPFPSASIISAEGMYEEVLLTVEVDRGPAVVFCSAWRWFDRPFSMRPNPPSGYRMRQSLFSVEIDAEGVTQLLLSDLSTGNRHDIYCFAMEPLVLSASGGLDPPILGMSDEDVERSRFFWWAAGPVSEIDGWHCVAGQPCSITNVRGDGLSWRDSILARHQPCPGICRCNGVEDISHKGAMCTLVSHEEDVYAPMPDADGNFVVIDRVDIRGPWCYVNPGACFDEEPSPRFEALLISYAACSFGNATVGRPGSGPLGFPDGGRATSEIPQGFTYSWGEMPLVAAGYAYHLCWCNGTTHACETEADYRLQIGRLHVAGPSAEQIGTDQICTAGVPCAVPFFTGHALTGVSRIVAVPMDPRGCSWMRSSPVDPPGLTGFTNYGVSELAMDGGRTFSWGASSASSITADGGVYQLCWCGNVDGCPALRPLDGEGFLAPAGRMIVIGPMWDPSLKVCGIGIECIVDNIDGYGLTGGDHVAILEECGVAAMPPVGWAAESIDELPREWVSGTGGSAFSSGWFNFGWLDFGPRFSAWELSLLGASPEALAAVREEIYNESVDDIDFGDDNVPEPVDRRGVWGFPNRGISQPDTNPGRFAWGLPAYAAAGTYQLCWCAARETCSLPEDFRARMGVLRLQGPALRPHAAQVRRCVKGAQCTIRGIQGEMPNAGQLLIANGSCGGRPAYGAPRDGISLPAPDGTSFSWGSDWLNLPPGQFLLCWCAGTGRCNTAADFPSFAGVLFVKAPLAIPRLYYCNLWEDCNVTDIFGEGLNDGDRAMVMTVCGSDVYTTEGFQQDGYSIRTVGGGAVFVMPPPITAGIYRVCWCASEAICVRGADFTTDLGMIVVGGPEKGALYHCYEWEPCDIFPITGTALTNGDRIRVIWNGANCTDDLPDFDVTTTAAPELGPSSGPYPSDGPFVTGFPQWGVSDVASEDGTFYSFGPEDVRSVPGIYKLCWCSGMRAPNGTCSRMGPFAVPAGTLRVNNTKWFRFVNRGEDPETRFLDFAYPYLLAVPLPFLICLAMVAGWRRLTLAQMRNQSLDPVFTMPKQKAWGAEAKAKVELTGSVKDLFTRRLASLGLAMASAPAGEDGTRDIDFSAPSGGNRSRVKQTPGEMRLSTFVRAGQEEIDCANTVDAAGDDTGERSSLQRLATYVRTPTWEQPQPPDIASTAEFVAPVFQSKLASVPGLNALINPRQGQSSEEDDDDGIGRSPGRRRQQRKQKRRPAPGPSSGGDLSLQDM